MDYRYGSHTVFNIEHHFEPSKDDNFKTES
jgi:hypothetical protein